jgi:cellobiose phosphorylase
VKLPRAVLPALVSRAESTPHGRLLSNGRWSTMLTGVGTGFAACGGRRLTAWSGDRVEDGDGCFVYLRDAESDVVWSVGRAPVAGRPERFEATYTPGRLSIVRHEHGIEALMDVSVAPDADAEVRRLALRNASERQRRIEVTTYAEVVLHDAAAHAAHPAFSKLFIQTAADDARGVLTAVRRPRGVAPEPLALAHGLFGAGAAEWTTDRVRFVGRGGSLAAPAGLAGSLPGTVGDVLDPMLAMRRTVRLEPGETAVLTAVLACAPTAAEAAALAARWRVPEVAEATGAAAEAHARGLLAAHGLDEVEGEYLQALAVALRYGAPEMRADESVLRRVRGLPALLAPLGVAPGRPLIVCEPSAAETPAVVRAVGRALAYWKAHGLDIEALVVGDDVAPGQRPAPPGVRVVAGGDVEPRVLDVARATAAMTTSGAWPALVPREAGGAEPSETPAPRPSPTRSGPRPGRPPLEMANGYGGFAAGGREYVIHVPAAAGTRPPMPWTNVLANPSVGCVVSESGAGCTWSRNSREHRLTPWANDPVVDPHGEALWVRDEASGALWSPQPGPAGEGRSYEVRHGFGYTIWRHASDDLEQEVTTFVAAADPVRLTRVRIANTGARPRRLSVVSYARLVLGVLPTDAPHAVVTSIDQETSAILAESGLREDGLDGVVVAAVVGAGAAERSATCDRAAFVGRGGTPRAPAALRARGPLAPRAGARLDPCAALQATFEVAPGASAECTFLLGDAATAADARALAGRYDSAAAVAAALAEARASWPAVVVAVQIRTPSRAIDLMVNGWLAYQTLACRMWGRTAFYQSGGAYGFRDQLQDAAALAWTRPDLTRAQLLTSAAHQFAEGDVLHWWHPPTDRGTRTRFADDLLWLPYVAAFYVRTTGDRDVLDEPIGFVTARPLAPGEDEAYVAARRTEATASLWAHCCLAVDRSLAVGAHGLPLMGTGDWNDGMNLVGREGRGESVWMGFFLHAVLGALAPLCESRGEAERAARYAAHRARLGRALEETAWDGGWYRRAWFDDGTPLGTAAGEECRIDLLPQAWSVIAGVASPAHAATALDAVWRELVLDPPGLVRLLAPPFDRAALEPGYIKGYVPGIRENGGQYTHAALWAVRATAELGRRDRAAALLEMLTPVAHGRTAAAVAVYQVEPYVVAADVYAAAAHMGRGGWTWYTGSAGWMLRVAVESVLGVTLEDGRRLCVRPRIPDAWPGFTLVHRLPDGRTRYDVEVENPDGVAAAVRAVTIDGAAGAVVHGAAIVLLAPDGAAHRVVVTLGAEIASPAGENT